MSDEELISEWRDDLGSCRLVRHNRLHYTEGFDVIKGWKLLDQGSASERIAVLTEELAAAKQQQIDLLQELSSLIHSLQFDEDAVYELTENWIPEKLAERRAEQAP